MSTIRSRWLGRLAARKARLKRAQAEVAAAQRVVARHPAAAKRAARPRSTSTKGVQFIAGYEGLRLEAYHLAGERFWTIGYGHYGADVKPGQRITRARAFELLTQDLHAAENAVLALRIHLNQNQFDALVSFVFNLGTGILAPSHTIGARLAAGDYKGAADAILLYDKDSRLQRLPGLTRRRQAERAMFLAA